MLLRPTSLCPNGWRSFATSFVHNVGKSPLGELRKKTGYSLSLCKDALAKNDNDVNKAFIWLKDQAQAQGWSKAQKLEGRQTAQGLVGIHLKGNSAVMVELNSETDFVARNKQFHGLLQTLVNMNMKFAKANTLQDGSLSMKILDKNAAEQIPQPDADGKTLVDLVALNIGQIGENLSLKRAAHFVSDKSNKNIHLVATTHPSGDVNTLSYGRYGVLLALEKDPSVAMSEEFSIQSLGSQLCQHVVGMCPETVGDLSNKDSWPVPGGGDKKAKEVTSQEEVNDGWEEEETVEVRDNLSTSAIEIIHQPFLFDPERLVRDILLENGVDIKGFVRFEVGQE